MFKGKSEDGSRNYAGKKIAKLRKGMGLSQHALAEKLQLNGLDVGKHDIQNAESGRRFITDVELKIFAGFFGVTADYLLLNE